MITGLDPKEVIEYVSLLDKEKDNSTKFLIGVVSGRDRLVLTALFEDKQDPKVFYDFVKCGLKGIKNLRLKNGEVKDIDKISDDVLDLLPTMVIKELFEKITEINFLTEKEIKN